MQPSCASSSAGTRWCCQVTLARAEVVATHPAAAPAAGEGCERAEVPEPGPRCRAGVPVGSHAEQVWQWGCGRALAAHADWSLAQPSVMALRPAGAQVQALAVRHCVLEIGVAAATELVLD